MHKLIIQDDEGKTTVVPLIREEITIGRKEGNTIRLTERNVSRRHARIVKANGSVFVEDLDSYNGVKVNGQRIQGRVPVTEQDRIQIGDYLLELRVDRGAQDAYSVSSATQTAPMEIVSLADLQPIPSTPPPPPIPGVQVVNAGNGSAVHAGYTPGPVGDMPPPLPTTAPMPVVETPARLVVVSSNFAGREFVLDKPAMVIGRTDDNDIVINHRSISRHHAKIVQEQGRFAVVDLQSANGVRVNGEEYGKVELRRGDVIDLGHVRLRYVETGEDFLFERDGLAAGVAIRPRKGGGKGLVVGTLAVMVVAGVAGVFVATRQGGGSQAAANPEPPVVASAEPTKVEVQKPPEAAPNPEPPAVAPQPPAPDVAKLLEEAKGALAEERWVPALAAAEQILKVDPQHAEAKIVQDKANTEFRNQTTYEKFLEQKDAGKVAEAMKLFGELPEDSQYREKAKPALAEMKEGFIKEREGEAKALKDKGQCGGIAALARRSAETFSEAKVRVEKAGAGCTAVAAREPRPERVAAVKPDRGDKPDKPDKTAEKPSAPEGTTDLDTLRKEAQEAARQHSWPTALKKANEVLKGKPDDVGALVVSAMASCYLGDKGKALKFYDRLADASRKNMVKQICTQVNIMLDEGD